MIHPEVMPLYLDNFNYEIQNYCLMEQCKAVEIPHNILLILQETAKNETKAYCLEMTAKLFEEVIG